MEAAVATSAVLVADPEVLSWDAIRARYPNQFVVLVDLIKQEFETGGRVYACGPDKYSIRDAAREAGSRYGCLAIRYTGEYGNPDWMWIRVPRPC